MARGEITLPFNRITNIYLLEGAGELGAYRGAVDS